MHFRTSSWRVIEVKGNDWPASRPGKKRKGSCRTVDGGGGNSSSGLSFRSQNQVTTTSYPPTLKLLENSPLVNSCGSLLTLQRHKESLERKRGQGSSLTLKFHHLSKAWTQVALAADLHPTPTPAPQPTKSISPSIDWSQLNNPPTTYTHCIRKQFTWQWHQKFKRLKMQIPRWIYTFKAGRYHHPEEKYYLDTRRERWSWLRHFPQHSQLNLSLVLFTILCRVSEMDKRKLCAVMFYPVQPDKHSGPSSSLNYVYLKIGTWLSRATTAGFAWTTQEHNWS